MWKCGKHSLSSPGVTLSQSQVGQSIHPLDSLKPIFGRRHRFIHLIKNGSLWPFKIAQTKQWIFLSKDPNSLILTHTKINLHTVQQFQYVSLNKQRSVILEINRWLGRSKPQQILGQQWHKRPSWAKMLLLEALRHLRPQRGKAGRIRPPCHENGCRKTIVFFRLVGLRKNKERNRSKDFRGPREAKWRATCWHMMMWPASRRPVGTRNESTIHLEYMIEEEY